MRTLIACTFAAALLVTLGAPQANAQAVQVQTAAGYGTAGCGLGSIVFGAKPGIIQIFAATTNGTSYSQTFGITSGTSNCTDTAPAAVQVSSFVETNRPVLAKDMARGQGETIATLSVLAGCDDTAAVGRALQKNFKGVFPTSAVSDVEVSDTVLSVLRDDSLSCQKI